MTRFWLSPPVSAPGTRLCRSEEQGTFGRRVWSRTLAATLATVLTAALSVGQAWGQGDVRVADLCRIKGQEENTLHGFGLVVGLKGTGDGDRPATRALAQTMLLMGNAIPRNSKGDFDLSELKNAKNVALVFVTAEVPPTGARQGGRIPCTVSAVSAKSLEGGTLLLTPLLGPLPTDRTTYALAYGPITLPDRSVPTVGVVHQGCQLQRDFVYQFEQEGYVTLVLKDNHADFRMAHVVEGAINRAHHPEHSQGDLYRRNDGDIAMAVDARNILVRIPDEERHRLVGFIADVLNVPVLTREVPGSRVVINERAKVVVVGEDVGIRPVAITHKNMTIEAGGQRTPTFTTLERLPAPDPAVTLRSLVSALNGLKVDTADIIDIIKALDRQGALWGELIIE